MNLDRSLFKMMYNHFGVGFTMNLIPKDKKLKILDLGCGYGFWGYMLRAYLDTEPYIVGVDINEDYLNRCTRMGIYDRLINSDCTEFVNALEVGDFDVGILSHLVEHLHYDSGSLMLSRLIKKIDKVIVLCPEGDALFERGGEGESHLSIWRIRSFKTLNMNVKHLAFSHSAGRVVSMFERMYFQLKGKKRGGVLVAWS